MSKKKAGFYIAVGCPGCGGEQTIEENFFVTTCPHCGSVLRLVMPDSPPAYLMPSSLAKREIRFSLDRFLKKESLPLTESDIAVKRLYYPFWKVDGLLLKVRNRVDTRQIMPQTEYSAEVVVDRERTEVGVTSYSTSVAAGTEMSGIPSSLGMRTDHVKLVPYSNVNIDSGFDALPVLRSWTDVQQSISKRIDTLRLIDPAAFGSNMTRLFHPVFSLVYSPYFVVESYEHGYRRFLLDGITARVLEYRTPEGVFDIASDTDGSLPDPYAGEGREPEPEENDDIPEVEFGAIEVEFHRCSTCGIDLPDEKSYLYVCRNCHEIKTLEKTPFPVNGMTVAKSDGKQTDRLFPFWAFQINATDAASLRPLFGGIHASDRLVIPAFRMQNFEAMYRLTTRVSAAFPQLDLEQVEQLDPRFDPVTVPMDEAMALGEVTIVRKQIDRSAGSRALANRPIGVQPVRVELFYAPFHPESYFFVDSMFGGITFEKNLVS